MKQVYAPEDNTREESIAEIDAARESLVERIIDDLKTFGRCDIETCKALGEKRIKIDMVDVFQHVLDNLPAKGSTREWMALVLNSLYEDTPSIRPLTDAAIEYLAEHS